MKSFILTSLTTCATFSTVLATLCTSPVILGDNAFATRQLFANEYYYAKVYDAVAQIEDPVLAARAKMIGDVGTFMWISQKALLPGYIESMIEGVPCTHILGLVIYDLPGRDCGGDASSGEFETGELSRYKAEYIDPLREVFLRNPNVAIALILEPDSLPNAITSLLHPRCAASVQEYKDGIAYALQQFDLPNVVQYIDAGNGPWLGWDPNVAPAAKVIADVWKAAGSPKSCKGIATNVANWNAWSQHPGEFENYPDAQYNKAQDEQRYIHLLGAELAANGMPNHAIVDTSRNGVTGTDAKPLRTYGGNWCNVRGAGFGIRPTSETNDDLCDAFVWVKPGGESDGGSDPALPGYDPNCANADAFIPSPRAGAWNQAQFVELVQNAIPDQYTTDGTCYANIFCGSWPAGSCCTDGVCGNNCGDTCTSGCGTAIPDTTGVPPQTGSWSSVLCDDPILTSTTANSGPARWAEAKASVAWSAANVWFKYQRDTNTKITVSSTTNSEVLPTLLYGPTGQQYGDIISDFFHGPDGMQCQNVQQSGCDNTGLACGQASSANAVVSSPAGQLILNSVSSVHKYLATVDTAITDAAVRVFGTAGTAVNDLTKFADIEKQKIVLDAILLIFGVSAAGFWSYGIRGAVGVAAATGPLKSAVQDTISALVVFGIGVTKDILPLTTSLNAAADFVTLGANICTALSRSNARQINSLFNGTDSAINLLTSLVDGGLSLSAPQPNSFDIANQLEATIVTVLMPIFWAADTTGRPWIMTDEGFSTGDCSATTLPPTIPYGITTRKAGLTYPTAYRCIGTRGFWLFGATTQNCVAFGKNGVQCTGGLNELTGIEDIDGVKFGGLSVAALLSSSIRAKAANGGNNGWKALDPTTKDGIGLIIEDGAAAAGIFNAPICSFAEAYANRKKAVTGNFPCN